LATHRCGDLLREIEKSTGGRPLKTSGGIPTSLTRTQAAKDAGLSKDQAVTAIRVSRIPDEEFQDAVEGEDDQPLKGQATMRKSKRKPKTEKAVPIQTETNGEKPEAQKGKFIDGGRIQPGHEMWTDGWRIHIGGLMGTDENPIRLPKPTKPEPKPESDFDKNSKTKTKR
jgi:hypothetical protein